MVVTSIFDLAKNNKRYEVTTGLITQIIGGRDSDFPHLKFMHIYIYYQFESFPIGGGGLRRSTRAADIIAFVHLILLAYELRETSYTSEIIAQLDSEDSSHKQ